MKERRKHRRIVVNKRAWLCDFDEDPSPVDPKDCLVVDISEGGACIQCSAIYKENQLIAFTYQDFMEEGFRPVAGVVTWSKRHSEQDYRYGIKFLGLNTQMLRRIQDIVVQAAEGTVPPEKARGKQKRLMNFARSLLPDAVKQQNTAVPWRVIKDTRNFYVHSYGAIDVRTVWDTLEQDIPRLKSACEAILNA